MNLRSDGGTGSSSVGRRSSLEMRRQHLSVPSKGWHLEANSVASHGRLAVKLLTPRGKYCTERTGISSL
ncbi:unnamed protein product [Boreogadus saida]